MELGTESHGRKVELELIRDVWFSLSHIIFGDRATHITAYYSDNLKAMVLTVKRDDERRYNILIYDDGTVRGLVQDL